MAAGRLYTYVRVQACAALLRLRGESKLAHKLDVGYSGWTTLNSGGYDFHLFFSSVNAQKLDSLLVDEERNDCLLVSRGASI